MSTKQWGESLDKFRNVTIILRLLVDCQGRVVHGEVVDTDASTWARFAGWRGLTRAIRVWLAR